MNRVFIPHVPAQLNAETKIWTPTVNIEPAKKFGELHVLFDPSVSRAAIAPMAAAMRERMRDFDEGDFVCALGDPTLIGVACAIATRNAGGLLRLLKWDRMFKEYVLIEVRP